MDIKNIFDNLSRGKSISIDNTSINTPNKNFIMYTNSRDEAVIIPTVGIIGIDRNGKKITINYTTSTLNYELHSEMDVEVVISRINTMRNANGEISLY